MASSDLRITLEIEPIVKLRCGCLECRFNIAGGDIETMIKDGIAYPEGFCLLKHVIINKDGQCVDKSIVQTRTQENSAYYKSRQYTCRDDDERCVALHAVSATAPVVRCVLPYGHQGKHLTPDDIEFEDGQ